MQFRPNHRAHDGAMNEQRFHALRKYMEDHRIVGIFCQYIMIDLFTRVTVRLRRMAVAIREILV
jgi:hypothetical protein